MSYKIIAATDILLGVAKDGNLPWNCPEDMQFFKKTTMGHPVIMGRKTRETLKKPLTGRLNIVLSSQKGPTNDQEVWVNSIEEAIKISEDGFVIGGPNIWKQFWDLKLIDTIYITQIAKIYHCDLDFPIDVMKYKNEIYKVLSDKAIVYKVTV